MWSWSEKKPSRAGGVFRRRCAWMGTAGAAGSARERGGALSAGPGGSPGGAERRSRGAPPRSRRPPLSAGGPRGHGGPGLRFPAGGVPRSAPPLRRGEVAGGSGCVRGKAAGGGFAVPRPVPVAGSRPLPGESGAGSEGGEKHLEGSRVFFFLLLLKPRVGRISISLLFPARSRTPPPLCPHRCSLCPGRGGSGTPTYRGAAFAVHLPLPFTGAGAASAPAPFSGGAAAR